MQRTLFDDEHAAFRAVIADFIQRDLVPELPRFRSEGAVDQAAWKAAGRLGLLGVQIPEPWGVGGHDYRFNAVAIEELATVSHGLSSTFSIHFDIVVPYLVQHATATMAQQWLPAMATGDAIGALALTEAEAGSDLRGMRTTAHADADGWVLSGSKMFITNGAIADVVVVAAREGNDARHGLSLFAVDVRQQGVRQGPTLRKLGLHESNTAALFFDDVRVPREALIGTAGRGMDVLKQRLAHERVSSAVANAARTRAVFTQTLSHARTREAFGSRIGSLQHNKFLLADLSASLEATTTFVDACIRGLVDGQLTSADAARAKLLTAELESRVLDTAMQLQGGAGFMADNDIGQAWIDARITRVWAGSSEVMREIVGRELDL